MDPKHTIAIAQWMVWEPKDTTILLINNLPYLMTEALQFNKAKITF